MRPYEHSGRSKLERKSNKGAGAKITMMPDSAYKYSRCIEKVASEVTQFAACEPLLSNGPQGAKHKNVVKKRPKSSNSLGRFVKKR
jgi:hypothetical protein